MFKNKFNQVRPKELVQVLVFLKNWHNRSEKEIKCLDESMKTWKTFSIALIKYFFPITWQIKENVAPLLLDWYDFRS